jgi:hypothetical protein
MEGPRPAVFLMAEARGGCRVGGVASWVLDELMGAGRGRPMRQLEWQQQLRGRRARQDGQSQRTRRGWRWCRGRGWCRGQLDVEVDEDRCSGEAGTAGRELASVNKARAEMRAPVLSTTPSAPNQSWRLRAT